MSTSSPTAAVGNAQRPLRRHRFRAFLKEFGAMIDENPSEERILTEGKGLLASFVRYDDWLPAAFAASSPERHQQYLLYCDYRARFSVVSFVWAPGQETPIHNHTVWGLIGMLRGSEFSQTYTLRDGIPVPDGTPRRLSPGEVDVVSPTVGDIHKVNNALSDQPSVSVHVYGADIGAVYRSVFSLDGTEKPFVSGYANDTLQNIWGMSYE